MKQIRKNILALATLPLLCACVDNNKVVVSKTIEFEFPTNDNNMRSGLTTWIADMTADHLCWISGKDREKAIAADSSLIVEAYSRGVQDAVEDYKLNIPDAENDVLYTDSLIFQIAYGDQDWLTYRVREYNSIGTTHHAEDCDERQGRVCIAGAGSPAGGDAEGLS